MNKHKKNIRTQEKIGKRWHNFDLKSEKKIYCYLCCIRDGIFNQRIQNNDLKFESYQQWKKYVNNKYENFDVGELIEFSRYLNHGIRIIKPTQEYMTIIITALITWGLTELIDLSNIKLGGDFRNNYIFNNVYACNNFFGYADIFAYMAK